MHDRLKRIQELAEAVNQLSTVDVPERDRSDEMVVERPDGVKWFDLEGDEEWWAAWCEVRDIVESTIGLAVSGHCTMRPDVEAHRQYAGLEAKTGDTSLSVQVYADGYMRVLAEHHAEGGDSWETLFQGRLEEEKPVDPDHALEGSE